MRTNHVRAVLLLSAILAAVANNHRGEYGSEGMLETNTHLEPSKGMSV